MMDTEYEIDLHCSPPAWQHTLFFFKGRENQCYVCHLHGQPASARMLVLIGYTQVILVTWQLMLWPFSRVRYRIMRDNRHLIRVCTGTLFEQPESIMVQVEESFSVIPDPDYLHKTQCKKDI